MPKNGGICMNDLEFERWLEAYARDHHFSGSVLVTGKGRELFRKYIGYADRENNIPITDSTRFRFYSLTKPLIAFAVMQLYEQGKLCLDAHPSVYLDCAEKMDSAVTVKTLLQHTSGLSEIASIKEFVKREDAALDKRISVLSEMPLEFAPGTGTEYRNTNYIILTRIVETVSSCGIGDYLRSNVFDLFGMNTADVELSETAQYDDLAVGYEEVDGEIQRGGYINMPLLSGAGCAIGGLNDVLRIYDAVRSRKYLKPETWELILTPSGVGSFGFGCSVFDWHGKRTYQNNGGCTGFRTLHRYLLDEDFDIIILSNTGYGNAREDISEAIWRFSFEQSSIAGETPQMDPGFVR